MHDETSQSVARAIERWNHVIKATKTHSTIPTAIPVDAKLAIGERELKDEQKQKANSSRVIAYVLHS